MRNFHDPLDVLIIGGGYSGLSCALTLQKNKKNFLLLEASAHAGGRALEQVLDNNFRLELGGQYIAPPQKRVTQLIKDMGLQTYQAWGQGNHFFLYVYI